MLTSTIQLISSDSTLIDLVREVVSKVKVEKPRLEIVPTIADACESRCRENIAVVISHIDERSDFADLEPLLGSTNARHRCGSILVISDRQNPPLALALMRQGVRDFLTRPLDVGRLAYLIESKLISFQGVRSLRQAKESLGEAADVVLEGSRPFIYSPSDAFGHMMVQVRRAASLDSTILLGGETGTGKTQLAGIIHRLSTRRDAPFRTINCGALSASLIESEMFGHVKGAFTSAVTDRIGKFAEVGQGTLFLDEIDSLPLEVQAKLLQVVEERVFEPVGSNKSQPMQARLIAACNRPLDEQVAAGRFRADLYYRINVFSFQVPPLRDRTWAIPHLAQSFIEEFDARSGVPPHHISQNALEALAAHTWPGNIRELRNVIERSVALCSTSTIELDDLPDHYQQFQRPVSSAAPQAKAPNVASLAHSKEQAECYRIVETLGRLNNNRLRAAAELGISRMTLYNKLHKYGLTVGVTQPCVSREIAGLR